MIVSKNGTSYDTSDGSEQPHTLSAASRQRSEREEINRWEDDGPGPHAHTAAPAAAPQRKPAWSVLSLRGLMDALRLQGRDDDPHRRRQREARAERDRLAAEQGRQRKADAEAGARRDRYRNAWENT
jgi:hypothetical protein